MAKPWHEVLKLRNEVVGGQISQGQFAADLHSVLMNEGADIYKDAEQFFERTYPTVELLKMAREVAQRLAGKTDKAVRQLHQTFGGGKTHSLITLVHLVRDPASLPDLSAVRDFREHCELDGKLPKARVAAVVFDRLDEKCGMECKAPNGQVRRLLMPWNVLAWQLAGEAGLRTLAGVDSDGTERSSPPSTTVMQELLQQARQGDDGVLLVFDEVLWYVHTMVTTVDSKWEQIMANFLHSLTQAVSNTPRCCLVASLLASDINKKDATGRRILSALNEEFERVADQGIQPVKIQDVPEILRRRLFEQNYDRDLCAEQSGVAVKNISKVDDVTQKNQGAKKEEYKSNYPFHPALLDVLYMKWTQLEGFQQTRGILKTLALALRDARGWDKSPIVGTQVLLNAPGVPGLSTAARELASTAGKTQHTGRYQNWESILAAELDLAQRAAQGLPGVAHREIEQAAIAVFLHSQPTGQQVQLREIKTLISGCAPDGIDLSKGLAQWAQTSWYLDEELAKERNPEGVPKQWRLGQRANLRQMHHHEKQYIDSASVQASLLEYIKKHQKFLTAEAVPAGAAVHMLPTQPGDIPDDGQFHYAVLGFNAACNGRPSSIASSFLQQAGPERNRATNSNVVVLLTPSRECVDAAQEKMKDVLAWEQVQRKLKTNKDGSVDATELARLESNLREAKLTLDSAILTGYCVAVAMNEDGKPGVCRLQTDGKTPPFKLMLDEKKLRISSDAVEASALLPEGPYGLWQQGETRRYMRDLVGEFATNAKLPKMLGRTAIEETLLQGCEAGHFVLRVQRPDKSERTFWRSRPDEAAAKDTSLELVLSEAASLIEISPALLVPGELPGLWAADASPLPLAKMSEFFNGQHTVEVKLTDNYSENQLVPAAQPQAITQALAQAVRQGQLWVVDGSVSLWGEDAPESVFTDTALLYPAPHPLGSPDVLQEKLPSAWNGGQSTVMAVHRALSEALGVQQPWKRTHAAIDEAIGLGLLDVPQGHQWLSWPCSISVMANVPLVAASKTTSPPPPPPSPSSGRKAASAQLEIHDVQELADRIGDLQTAAAGKGLRILVTVELGDDSGADLPQDVAQRVNDVLQAVKPGWSFT